MIASQFNLDHRLAELRQTAIQGLRGSSPSASRPGLLSAIRSLLRTQRAGRPARLAAH